MPRRAEYMNIQDRLVAKNIFMLYQEERDAEAVRRRQEHLVPVVARRYRDTGEGSWIAGAGLLLDGCEYVLPGREVLVCAGQGMDLGKGLTILL
jgi:hypothetical protein